MAQRNLTPIDLPEQAAPSTPATGYGRLYVNTSGQLVFIEDGGTVLNISAMFASAVGYINHGSVAATSRPTGYGMVIWTGTVTPDNMANHDIFINET